jgi:hypothetical protein
MDVVSSASSRLKIGHCFFGAYQYQRKMVNCVPASAAAQHIEASIKQKQELPNNKSGFCCQFNVSNGIENSGRFE